MLWIKKYEQRQVKLLECTGISALPFQTRYGGDVSQSRFGPPEAPMYFDVW
jgi:hypothetical protein